MTKTKISAGAPWGEKIGYSRAVRSGPFVWVSGTTATNEKGEIVGVDDPYRQTQYALEKIGNALKEAGASFEQVIRTRLYVTKIDDWQLIAQAHGEVFRTIQPACTIVEVSRLIDPNHLVEIEVDAYMNE